MWFQYVVVVIVLCPVVSNSVTPWTEAHQASLPLTISQSLPKFMFIIGFSVHSVCCTVLCLVTQSCLTFCDPMHFSLPDSSLHGNSPGKYTGVSSSAFLQGLFPTQGSNPGLLHCRRILYCLSHQGSFLDLPVFYY